MDNLEPITRNEMFLNGDDLEPITREEMILAGADLEPITRHEWFLKRYRGGGGGGGYDLVNIPDLPADIASFNDGTDLPMASLKVAVTPYQDLSHGDPSPENICPIIGWDEAVVTRCGKNLFDKVNCGVYNGYISTKISNSSNHKIVYIPCKPNTTYSCSNFSGNERQIITYSSELPYNNLVVPTPQRTITTDANAKYLLCYCYNGTSDTVTFDDVKDALDIELGSVAPTSYSPYNGATYTIDLNGTRYGVDVDAVSGTMTVYWVGVDMGDLNWVYDIDRFKVASSDISPRMKSVSAWNVANPIAICEIYKYENVSVGNQKDNVLGTYNGDFYARDTNYTDANIFKTAVDGKKIIYELATPITVQLAPTPVKSIEGVNKIFANCGQITEGKYFKKA